MEQTKLRILTLMDCYEQQQKLKTLLMGIRCREILHGQMDAADDGYNVVKSVFL